MAADAVAAAPNVAAPLATAARAPQPEAGKLLAGQGPSAKPRDAMQAVQAASGGSSEYTGAAGADAAAASDEARQPAFFGVSLQGCASSLILRLQAQILQRVVSSHSALPVCVRVCLCAALHCVFTTCLNKNTAMPVLPANR